MISNKLYKISKLLISGNINQLSNLFQDKWMYDNLKIDYNELNEKEKEDLKQYIEDRKKEVENEINSKVKNSQYKSWIYDMLIKRNQTFEDIDKMIEEIKNLEYLKKNKNVLNEKLDSKLENKDFDIKTYKTFGELHRFTFEYLELFKKRALKTNNLKPDFEKVFSGQKYEIYKITKKDKDLFQNLYGKTGYNTAWCVANKNEIYFEEYLKDNSDCYYLFTLKNEKPYALLNFNSSQFKDVHDDKLNDFSDDILDFLVDFVDIFYFEEDLKEYFIDTVKKKNPNITQNEIFVKLNRRTKINENGNIDSLSEINKKILKDFVKDGKLTIKFNKVVGDFDCHSFDLTSLEGCPKTVVGNFYCDHNNLNSLEFGPEQVFVSYHCNHNKLTNLIGSPEIISKDFICSYNQLISLDGCTKNVSFFDCSCNNLTNLKSSPDEVDSIDCSENKLTSLDGLPKKINAYLDCSHNKLTSLDGLPDDFPKEKLYCSNNLFNIN